MRYEYVYYYSRGEAGEYVVRDTQQNDMEIAITITEQNAALVCNALNARESLARALGVKLDDASI